MTCQVVLLFLNGKKIARRLIQVNFVLRKVNSNIKAKIEMENHFNMCVQEGIVNKRSMTKYDTKHHHERFTAKLQVYSLAIFKIVQSHYLRQKYSNIESMLLKTFAPTIHRVKRRSYTIATRDVNLESKHL